MRKKGVIPSGAEWWSDQEWKREGVWECERFWEGYWDAPNGETLDDRTERGSSVFKIGVCPGAVG